MKHEARTSKYVQSSVLEAYYLLCQAKCNAEMQVAYLILMRRHTYVLVRTAKSIDIHINKVVM